MRIQVSMDDDLVAKIDAYCKEYYMSRSGFFSFVANQHLIKDEISKTLSVLRSAMIKVSEGKDLSEDEVKNLTENLTILDFLENSHRIEKEIK